MVAISAGLLPLELKVRPAPLTVHDELERLACISSVESIHPQQARPAATEGGFLSSDAAALAPPVCQPIEQHSFVLLLHESVSTV